VASKPKTDLERESRIRDEIVVDAYGPEERALGWHCYLQDQLQFPFKAKCIAKRITSPLCVGDKVEVLGMPGEGECEHEMLVTIRWEKDGLVVPLTQLKPAADADNETKQAVGDWHYWVQQGYEF
jgi:hypothetical protein